MVFSGAALPAAYCCLKVGPLGPAGGAAERAKLGECTYCDHALGLHGLLCLKNFVGPTPAPRSPVVGYTVWLHSASWRWSCCMAHLATRTEAAYRGMVMCLTLSLRQYALAYQEALVRRVQS